MRLNRLAGCLFLAILFPLIIPPAAAAQADANRFELRGKVINAISGEPVGKALVEIPGQRAHFSDSDGTFVFADLPRGRLDLSAKKPGFFGEREPGSWIVPDTSVEVPADRPILVKLTPEAIIYGEVKNSDGEPLDGITVRAERWQMADGRRQLQPAKQATTDDEGNFRLAELVPGKYYLAFLPGQRGGSVRNGLPGKRKQEEGYGLQFYPGVADAASASAFQIRAGAQVHVTHTFLRQRLFQVSGTVRGATGDGFFDFTLTNSSGEPVPADIRIDRKTGEFQIPGIPAGNYLLTVNQFRSSMTGSSDIPPLTATQPVHVGGDLSGVIVTPGAGISVAVQVRDELSSGGNEPHRVFVRMALEGFLQHDTGIVVPPPPEDHRTPNKLEDLAPGTYLVEAQAMVPQSYVAELRCGAVDLLRDDLTVAPGSAPPPIEVTLRDDIAQLTAGTKQPGRPAAILVYSSDFPRRSVLMPFPPGSPTVSFPSLPPGVYQVLALASVGDLEFRNPVAVERYLAHATSLTLQPHDNTTVSVDIVEPLEPPE
jgi:carboxypeptidase family protein